MTPAASFVYPAARQCGRTFTLNFWSLLVGAGVAMVAVAPNRPAPLALFNATPSEPIGVYVRDRRPARVGTVVAFTPPLEAKRYEDERGGRLSTFLKTVAAAGGDQVCVSGRTLFINNAARGRVTDYDRFGQRLPQWRGCRALSSKELFVFSNRVANSFDSRYFGPIDRASVVGVFHPAFRFSGGVR